MVKDHSDSERGNLLLPHGLLFPISSKGSFICIITHTTALLHQSWSTGWNKKLLNGSTMKDRSDDPSHHELLPHSYMCTNTSTIDYGRLSQCFCWSLCSQSTRASNVKNIVMVKISHGKVTCAHSSCLTTTVTLEKKKMTCCTLFTNGRHHFTYSQVSKVKL